MSFRGLGETNCCDQRRCLYSWLNVLPLGKESTDPEQALNAVKMERNAFDFPLRVYVLQHPKPVGSIICHLCDIGTRLPVVMVRDLPG